MGRHTDSDSSSSSGSDDDSRSRKRARKDDKKSSRHRDSSSSKSHKRSSKSSKKEHKKKDSRKSSKSERKHSKSHKSERKRKRSRSASSTDDSDSDSSRSRSRSASSRRAAASAASTSSGKSVPTVPPPSASSVARCLQLIDTLLEHGGGARGESLEQLQFMLFKLDSGSCVDTTAISDELVKHILNTMLREAGCKIRRDPGTNEQGWMTPADAKGRPGYKLLDVLAEAFRPKKAPAATNIGPAMPPSAASAAAASAAASSSDATVTAVPRVVGPAMPSAEDFERLAAGGAPDADVDGDDDGGNFGPKLPSQMTQDELAAYDRLRASREHLAAVKHMEEESGVKRAGGREEWMTALPSASSGMPTTAMLVNLAASGDREALRGRGFSSKGVQKVEQDDAWTLGPAEKARREAEKLAMRQAEQAVYNSARAITGDLSDLTGGRGRQSANDSAAAAQAANDRMMARYKKQQQSAADSLMAAHAREAEEAAKAAKPTDGLFRWDHAKEMGMRAVKGTVALKKEMQSAFALSDNFAPAGSG